MTKRLVSGNFSSIPMATLITATMDLPAKSDEEESENIKDGEAPKS